MKIRIAALSVGCALAFLSASAGAVISDKKAHELMNKGGCIACHRVDTKLVGPAFKTVAKKRHGEKGALAFLLHKVRNGGSGVYGQIPMPPNPKSKISDSELKELVQWVLSR